MSNRWATPKTLEILKLLHNHDVALSLRGIEINMTREGSEISYTTIKNQIPKAELAGAVSTIDEKGQWYEITDEGREYLFEELDASELEEQDG